MATEDCTELLTSGSQPENAENDIYNDANITATLTTSEKKGEDFQTALEDDKKAEEVKVNTAVTSTVSEIAVEISTTMVDGQEKADELGEKEDGENDKKVEAVNSSSNKETKKIVRKRKKNAEEASAHTVLTPPKKMEKKSSMKMKETSLCDKSMEGNEKKEVKRDGKLESIVKIAIPEDEEKEKADKKDVEVVKKVEGTVNKAVKIVKKKVAVKAKGLSSNAESAPTKSANVVSVAATSSMEVNAKQSVKTDENLASTDKKAIPAVVKKDVEGTKGKNIKKEEKKVTISSTSSIDADKVNHADKPSPLATEKHLKKADTAEKQLKKVDGMGLIFMCNAKTKKDCFKYNVLGLPESKRALVSMIYKGMRLFLFDVDLKLLYGIYKAASPGGYNIEPKAFDSKFPSQVRFTVLRDSLPLPEEKFKAAIRENYFKWNKFNCQLSPEQVKNLCKLFQSGTSSGSIQKHRAGAIREVTMPSSRTREPKRRHVGREPYPSPPPGVRHLSPHPRGRYLSPPPQALPLQTHPRVLLPPQRPSYTYERPGDDYYYRRDHHSALDLEMRPRDPPLDYQDSYILYREPGPYREPAYHPPSLPSAYASRLREPRSPPRYLY